MSQGIVKICSNADIEPSASLVNTITDNAVPLQLTYNNNNLISKAPYGRNFRGAPDINQMLP